MCMIGYTLLNGSKVFAAAPKGASVSYKLVSMILACTGGGILVPLFINAIPVPLANDLYPLAILVSFAIHYYFPIVWEVIKLSPLVKVVPRDSSDTVIVCGPHVFPSSLKGLRRRSVRDCKGKGGVHVHYGCWRCNKSFGFRFSSVRPGESVQFALR